MCASVRVVGGFKPYQDSVLCFHDMPMFITTGMVVKARLDSGFWAEPEVMILIQRCPGGGHSN